MFRSILCLLGAAAQLRAQSTVWTVDRAGISESRARQYARRRPTLLGQRSTSFPPRDIQEDTEPAGSCRIRPSRAAIRLSAIFFHIIHHTTYADRGLVIGPFCVRAVYLLGFVAAPVFSAGFFWRCAKPEIPPILYSVSWKNFR